MPARPTRADLREIVALAIPVVTVQLGLMLMGTVDTLMVGRVSEVALAGAALGNLYFYTVALFGMGTLYVLDPLVSQAVGAKDEGAITLAVQRGLALAGALALAGSAALLLARPVLTLLRQPPEVVAVAASYGEVSVAGLLPFLAFTVFRQALQAMGRLREVVVTTLVANVLNAVLNWITVYGNLGFPAMGAVGSAWSTAICRFVMAGSLLAMAWPRLRAHVAPTHPDALRLRPILAMAAIGVPIGVQYTLEAGAFNAIAILMGWLGTTELAGHEIALNIASLTFMVPVGVGVAGSVLVGRAVGAGDMPGARRAAMAALLCGVGFMAVSAVMLLSFPAPLARLFTTETGAAAVAASLIPLAGIFQVFDGMQVVSAGTLRGIGDTQAPVAINLAGFWLLGVPLSLWLGFGRGMGAPGLWWGLVAGLAAVACFLLARVWWKLRGQVERIRVDGIAGVRGSG